MYNKMVNIEVHLMKMAGYPPQVLYTDKRGRVVDIVDKKYIPRSVKEFFRKCKAV